MTPLLLLLCVLAILDVITTRKALSRPNVREANPIIRWLMRHGDLWIIVKLIITAAAAWALRDSPQWLAAICAIYAAVVYSNHRLGRRP